MLFILNIIFLYVCHKAIVGASAGHVGCGEMRLSNWALLLVTAMTFAISLPFNNVLVTTISPILLALLRAMLAFPAMWFLAYWRGGGLPADRGEWWTSAVGGLLIVAVPFSAIAWGQQRIASGLGGVLYGSMPLMTAAFAHFLLAEERMTLRKLVGLAVGSCGLIIVLGPSTLLGLGRAPLGEAATLVAPLSYALGSVLLKRRPPMNPLRLTAGMFLVGEVVMLPAALIETPGYRELSHLLAPRTAGLLLGLAVAGTAAPAFLNYLLIVRSGALSASLVMFIMPVFALILGTAMLGEIIRINVVAGLTCILLGSWIITRNLRSNAI
jgi:drug/metabolite transporter (DMT)-like permease